MSIFYISNFQLGAIYPCAQGIFDTVWDWGGLLKLGTGLGRGFSWHEAKHPTMHTAKHPTVHAVKYYPALNSSSTKVEKLCLILFHFFFFFDLLSVILELLFALEFIVYIFEVKL